MLCEADDVVDRPCVQDFELRPFELRARHDFNGGCLVFGGILQAENQNQLRNSLSGADLPYSPPFFSPDLPCTIVQVRRDPEMRNPENERHGNSDHLANRTTTSEGSSRGTGKTRLELDVVDDSGDGTGGV